MTTGDGPPGLPEWLRWSTEEVRRWVGGLPRPVVMGWPSNGTRRWYLAHRRESGGDEDYLSAVIRRQAEQHRMVLEHGVGVLVVPSFGDLNLQRGDEYARYALSGLTRLAEEPVYKEMFASGVRLRFYGSYEEVLKGRGHAPLADACEELMSETSGGDGPLILMGLFADSAHEEVSRLSVGLARRNGGRAPDRRELVRAYYGVEVPDLGLFVGFEQPQLFDVPLITTGREDLYATLNPSFDVDQTQLREILYDHLVTRAAPEVDYEALPPESILRLMDLTREKAGMTVGLGRLDPSTGTWQPLPPRARTGPRPGGREGV